MTWIGMVGEILSLPHHDSVVDWFKSEKLMMLE